MKFWWMNSAVFRSSYDSASSRAQAPHAGAALKSSRMGRSCSLAETNARSTSWFQFTAMFPSFGDSQICKILVCRKRCRVRNPSQRREAGPRVFFSASRLYCFARDAGCLLTCAVGWSAILALTFTILNCTRLSRSTYCACRRFR